MKTVRIQTGQMDANGYLVTYLAALYNFLIRIYQHKTGLISLNTYFYRAL